MKNNKHLFHIISLFLIFPLFYLSCSCKSTPLEGEVTFLVGTMKINSAYASVGSRVIKGDMLLTGEKSEAVIQLSESAVITLKADTEMLFENLSDGTPGAGTASLQMNRGTSLHKVLKSGSEYSVKAPTAVASVRGTEFEMTADETRTIIKVKSGTVYVRKISEKTRTDKSITESQHKGDEEIILREGDSLQIYTLGAGALGSSDRSITSVTGTEKAAVKQKETAGRVKKDKTESAKSAEKGSARSRTESVKKQSIKKDSVKKTSATEKRDAGKAAGTASDSDNKRGTTGKDKSADRDSKEGYAAGNSTDTKTADTVKERQKTAADKAKTSVVETNDAKKRNGSTSDSGDDKIRKSKDIAAGREKNPDPDAVKALINNKNRNLNDIRQVYNRIDRVHLYSGKIITGAITERGDTYTILTTEGMVKVSKKDIQSNDIIK